METLISDLRVNEIISSYFVLESMGLRTDRNQSDFLVLYLRNDQSRIKGYLWNDPLNTASTLVEKQTVKVEGIVKNLNGSMVIKITQIAVPEDNAQIQYFQAPLHEGIHYCQERLFEMIGQIKDYNCKRIIESFINDEIFFRDFISSPAGIRIHHAYSGGLLEHTVYLMSNCCFFAEEYQGLLNKDLLITGAFLHDIGKTKEMSLEDDDYTTEGKLLGHVLIGLEMLDEKVSALGDIPGELAMALKHMLISHHGKYNAGSPVPPQTPEAFILHMLDNVDASLNRVKCHIGKSDPMADWSRYDKIAHSIQNEPSFQRKPNPLLTHSEAGL